MSKNFTRTLLVLSLIVLSTLAVDEKKKEQKKEKKIKEKPKRAWSVMPTLNESQYDLYMTQKKLVLNVVIPESDKNPDSPLNKLLTKINRYAYEERYSLSSEGKRNNPIRFSKTVYGENETAKSATLQFIQKKNILFEQKITEITTLKDVRNFLRHSYFDAVFHKLESFEEGYDPKEFQEKVFNIVFYGNSQSKNGQALAQWAISRHLDSLFAEFGFFYVDKSYNGLLENQMGMFRREELFLPCKLKKLSANKIESWIAANQYVSPVIMTEGQRRRFNKLKKSSFVLYIDKMDSKENKAVLKEVDIALKKYQENSELTFLVELGDDLNYAAHQFAMERGFIPSQHKLPCLVYYDIMDFGKEMYHYTYFLEDEINEKNLLKFRTEHQSGYSRAHDHSDTATGIKDTLVQNLTYDDSMDEDFTNLLMKKDMIVLYYYSEYWHQEQSQQALEQFDALVAKVEETKETDIRFFKMDLSKNHPSYTKLNVSHAPIVRAYSYKKGGAYKDLVFIGGDEQEITKFVLKNVAKKYGHLIKVETEEDIFNGKTDL